MVRKARSRDAARPLTIPVGMKEDKDLLPVLALLSIVICSAGCGTLMTAVEDGRGEHWRFSPYSGTRISAGGHSTQIDLPFSLMADTMLLPITIPKYLIDRARKEMSQQAKSHQSELHDIDSELKVWFIVVGFFTCLTSNLCLIRSCFKKSKRLGIAGMYVPFTTLYFGVKHWPSERKWLIPYLAGLTLMLVASFKVV